MEEQKPKKNVIALVGFIVSFFLAITGLILSIIGAVNAKRCDGHWKGFAIAGIVISVVKMVFTILIIVLLINILNIVMNFNDGEFGNFIHCLQVESCTENADGTFTCIHNDETYTCEFDINNLTIDVDNTSEDIENSDTPVIPEEENQDTNEVPTDGEEVIENQN